MKTAVKLLQPGALGLSTGGSISPPVISFGSGSGYAGSTYSVTNGGVGEWWVDGVASGITATSFVESFANEGKARYWRRADAVTSNIIEMWAPSDIANLVMYLDARQGITAPGNAVNNWVNQVAGSTPAAQASGTLQPAYQALGFNGVAPAVFWDGTRLLNGVGPISDLPTVRTYAAALQINSPSNSRGFFDGNTAGCYGLRMNAATDTISIMPSGGAVMASTAGAVARDVPKIFSARVEVGVAYSFRDGGLSIGAGVPTGVFTGSGSLSRVGSDRLGTLHHVGLLSTQLAWDTYASDIDASRIDGFLAWTLASTNLLDAGHTFKNAPPRLQ